jgi:TolB-like protein/Tfp pilus assembly protein PilF/tRNA A-37 threonylcarbamoyl transferase component Bud32
VTSDLRDQLQGALGASYTIDRELGGGGMSRVFVADEEALGRKVVVKVVAPELAEGLSLERFAREVRLAARLQHANIVPVLTAGASVGLPYYTMPFVDGLSLRARLQHGAPPIAETVSILRDVARALAYAHAQGVVHRDIKPENVLLSGGAAVVTDFGIAKALVASRAASTATAGATTTAGLTSAGSSLGTPAYMAPEQAVGDPTTDHRADIYAWGVVAWELLAGVHPFGDRTSAHALVAAHVRDTPPSIADRRRDVPPSLAALVMRCLEKDPGRRPASATELLESLDAVATPPSSPSAGVRRIAPLAIGAAAIAIVAVGAVGLVIARRSADERRVAPSAVVPGDASATKALAVLPFSSVGGDTANLYFAEGIADELTTALARMPGLTLAGRSSAARFKQQGASAQEIGTALSVGAVLDGTVRRAGDRIRVSAELTSAADGRLLWKESYERELKDVFAVQDDIARAIVGALRVQLAGDPSASASSRGTSSLEAYDLYLRALRRYRRRGGDLVLAERELSRAIALDPSFARAHALLASVLSVTPYYLDTHPGVVLARARAAAERAVALDPGLAEAHAALGHVFSESFEWSRADDALRRAASLGPSNAEIAFRQGFTLITSGRVRESIAAFDRAEAIDPFYGMAAVYGGWAKVLVGRRDEGIAEVRRALELEPENEAVNSIFSEVLQLAGLGDEAVAHARRRLRPSLTVRRLGQYGLVLGVGGSRADAQALVRRVEAMPDSLPGRISALFRLHLALGDTTRALDALERAAAGDGDLVLSLIVASPHIDRIRQSPRFAAAARRFNLDVEWVASPDGGRSR